MIFWSTVQTVNVLRNAFTSLALMTTTWLVIDWSENITVLDDCVLNIKQLLEDEEISY